MANPDHARANFETLLRAARAGDLALMEWLQKYIFPAEAKTVSPEFVRAGTRLAALEMIQSGTTTYADMYYFEEEIARATREAGIRGVLGQTIIQFPVSDAKTPAEGIARAIAFIQQWRNDDLIVPAIAFQIANVVDEPCRASAQVGIAEHRDFGPAEQAYRRDAIAHAARHRRQTIVLTDAEVVAAEVGVLVEAGARLRHPFAPPTRLRRGGLREEHSRKRESQDE